MLNKKPNNYLVTPLDIKSEEEISREENIAFGMADIFWKGKDDFNSLDITAAATQPNVTIMEPLSAQTDFIPDAKATISIVYNTSI